MYAVRQSFLLVASVPSSDIVERNPKVLVVSFFHACQVVALSVRCNVHRAAERINVRKDLLVRTPIEGIVISQSVSWIVYLSLFNSVIDTSILSSEISHRGKKFRCFFLCRNTVSYLWLFLIFTLISLIFFSPRRRKLFNILIKTWIFNLPIWKEFVPRVLRRWKPLRLLVLPVGRRFHHDFDLFWVPGLEFKALAFSTWCNVKELLLCLFWRPVIVLLLFVVA